MAAYKPRKPRVSIYYKKTKKRRHAAIILTAVAVIGAASFGTHALLAAFPKTVPTGAPVASTVKKAVSTAQASAVIDKSAWELRLVNASHPLPISFTAKTTAVKNARFDSRAAGTLEKMIDDCNNSGYHLLICSGYRSISYQTTLYKTEIRKAERKGAANAAVEAATVVAKPGTSEHNLGLAVDFGSTTNQLCDETFEKTPEGQWLIQNAYKYGFILRYPKGKEQITGIIYEPWHYRYVGVAAAKQMHDQGVCLEEYLA